MLGMLCRWGLAVIVAMVVSKSPASSASTCFLKVSSIACFDIGLSPGRPPSLAGLGRIVKRSVNKAGHSRVSAAADATILLAHHQRRGRKLPVAGQPAFRIGRLC